MVNDLSIFFILFAGFMSWTIALGQILEDNKQIYNYLFSAVMFCLGSLQLLDGLLVAGKLWDYSLLIFGSLPFLAIIGPLFFFTFKSANNDSFRFRKIDYLHFASGLITLLLLAPLMKLDAATKMSFIMQTPNFTSDDPLLKLYSGILIAVILNLVGYEVYFVRECRFMLNIRLIKEKKVSPYLITVILVSFPLEIVLVGSMVVMGMIEHSPSVFFGVLQSLTALSFVLTLVIFIMEKKNINFFKLLYIEIENRRYEISKIKNLDVAHVLSKIQSLMGEKKIFFDENLTMNDLAREIAIEPYQLSQIINENFNKNFNCFVNEYRIEEAKKILLADVERTVTSIAYAVGFNSTTVFYDWFTRLTGISPKKFRNNNK
ncbi:MAG: helix-turn-helix transcriptional regulator [Spirochaetes bacterium]|nr:helix-turn-helix transcriptional regulator [Spirochaetota bacterium]